jgi:hypothetical protein
LNIGKELLNGMKWSKNLFQECISTYLYASIKYTPQLKAEKLNKLAVEEPGITFKINTLEDFIQ